MINKSTFHKIRRGAPAVLAVALLLQLVSCASFGTKTRVPAPEALQSIDKVAVWPVTVVPLVADVIDKFPALIDTMFTRDPSFRKETVDMGMYTEELLVTELVKAGLFELVKPDSVVAAVSPDEWIDFRLDRFDWHAIINMPGVEYILVTDVRFKTGAHGANSYVTLCVFDWQTQQLIAESKFNTMWGKNYMGWSAPGVGKTLPDGIEGAVKGLAKAWREHTNSD